MNWFDFVEDYFFKFLMLYPLVALFFWICWPEYFYADKPKAKR